MNEQTHKCITEWPKICMNRSEIVYLFQANHGMNNGMKWRSQKTVALDTDSVGLSLGRLYTSPPGSQGSALSPVQGFLSAQIWDWLTISSRKRGSKEEFGRIAKAWVSRTKMRSRPLAFTVSFGGKEAQMKSCICMSGNILATCNPQGTTDKRGHWLESV